MSTPVWVWIQFLACAALIGAAGSQLSRYGDAIARHTGLSSSWIGLTLVASVTSLPELSTGITSVTIAQARNLAVGNALGSCVLNLAFLVRVVGSVSVGLAAVYLLNTYVVFLHGA